MSAFFFRCRKCGDIYPDDDMGYEPICDECRKLINDEIAARECEESWPEGAK